MALDDSAELLTTIKARGSIPPNAGLWTDAVLLKAATDEIRTHHVPLLVAAKGEYLVRQSDIPVVQAQEEYLISYRAAAIRHMALLKDDNREWPLSEIEPPMQSPLYLDRTRQGTPLFYWFRDGYFGVWPLPDSAANKVRVRWHIRPNRLVVTSDCWQISSIAVNTPTAGKTRLSFATTAPTAMGGATGTLYDFISKRNPYPIKGFDVASQALVTGGVSTTMDFTSVDLPCTPDALAIGDWVAAAEYTPHPNIPSELHSPAALRAAAVAVGSRNHQMRDALLQEAAGSEGSLLHGILSPRSKGNVKRIVTRRWNRR